MILVTCLTICVKLGPSFKIARWDFSPFNYLELTKLDIIQESWKFDNIIGTIYATGFTSICLFFLMKKFNVALAVPSDKDVSCTYIQQNIQIQLFP